MADNGYVEGNSIEDLLPKTNPFADPQNFAILKGIEKVDGCDYSATFQYDIAAGGATTTITPLTGNTGVKYYSVCVYDGMNRICGTLDLLNPANPFIIDTSTLDANYDWILEFSGAETATIGDAPCGLIYQVKLGSPAGGAISRNTTPA